MASLRVTVASFLVVASQWTYSNSMVVMGPATMTREEALSAASAASSAASAALLAATDLSKAAAKLAGIATSEPNAEASVSTAAVSDQPTCPDDWETVGVGVSKQCFQVPVDDDGPVKLTWLAARDHCVQDLQGDLAHPNNLTALNAYLSKDQFGGTGTDKFWLGGSSTIEEGKWRWNNGAKIPLNPNKKTTPGEGWKKGQPDEDGDTCLYMERNNDANSFGDKTCDNTSEVGFVCELKI